MKTLGWIWFFYLMPKIDGVEHTSMFYLHRVIMFELAFAPQEFIYFEKHQ